MAGRAGPVASVGALRAAHDPEEYFRELVRLLAEWRRTRDRLRGAAPPALRREFDREIAKDPLLTFLSTARLVAPGRRSGRHRLEFWSLKDLVRLSADSGPPAPESVRDWHDLVRVTHPPRRHRGRAWTSENPAEILAAGFAFLAGRDTERPRR